MIAPLDRSISRWQRVTNDRRDLLAMTETLMRQRMELRRLNARIFDDFVQAARSFCDLVDQRDS